MKVRTKGFFFYLVLVLYVLIGLLTVGGLVAPYFPVHVFPEIQFAPIFSVFLLPAHVIVLLYLGRYSRKWIFISLLLMATSIWIGLQDYNWNTKQAEQPNTLRVVSFNVRTFNYKLSNVDSVALLLKTLNPDVVCLQEFRNNKLADGKRAQEYLAKALGLPYHTFTRLPIHIQGGVIFSRYPITQIDTLYMSKDEINSGILVTLKTPQGLIGVANAHMSSYRLEGTIKGHNTWKSRIKAIWRQSREVLLLQQQKTDAILAKTLPYEPPLILAADMNSVAHTRITSQFKREMFDSFVVAGDGFGWTFPLLGDIGLRIDYQFLTEEWEVLEHRIIPSTISDHYPVLGVYRLK